MAFVPQNFRDRLPPAVSAAWLNALDVTANSVLAGATTPALARAALTVDNPLEISAGGTNARTAAAALANLGGIDAATLAAAVTQQALGSTLFPRTNAENVNGIIPVNYQYQPGVVDRYGTNTTPGTTDMTTAVQAAATANNGVITFLNFTYLFSNITLTAPVIIQGFGFGSVLLAKTSVIGVTTYSQNLFTSNTAIDFVTVQNLTLDGGCNNANPNTGDNSEISLIRLTATSKVTIQGVKLTRYCGSWAGVTKPLSASFWQAITIMNADKVAFLNCLLTDNHYEMVAIWNGPSSDCEILIDGCSEINTGTPNAHTAFEATGGHATVIDCFFKNTGIQSTVNINVPKSLRVANCTFLDQQPGAAAQINVGQDVFPYNNNILIENNYLRNANSAAIDVGPGNNVVIRGNIIDTPANYGVKLTGGVTSYTTFAALCPEWPAGSASVSKRIKVVDCVINGVTNASSISQAIRLHTVTVNAGWWFQDVEIARNTVTAAAAPNNTFWAIWVDDMLDSEIRDNWLQYTQNGVYSNTIMQNVRIDSNTFGSIQPFTGNDIVQVGAYSSSNVKIRNNQFLNYPVGASGSVNVFAGSIISLDVTDNIGIHPTLPVTGMVSTNYVLYQTRGQRVTVAPAAGDWGLNDIVKNVPAAAAPGEYICTVPGSFGSALTCTATGTAGNAFFTCSAIGQLHIGQHFTVAGAGPAAANLQCTCVYITGSTFYIDQVISTSVATAVMTLTAPTFVKSANYT